jgi:hypothetical protein
MQMIHKHIPLRYKEIKNQTTLAHSIFTTGFKMKFQFFTANMKTRAFWYIAPCPSHNGGNKHL